MSTTPQFYRLSSALATIEETQIKINYVVHLLLDIHGSTHFTPAFRTLRSLKKIK